MSPWRDMVRDAGYDPNSDDGRMMAAAIEDEERRHCEERERERAESRRVEDDGMTDLLERLRSWAQNEEMIDQYYTDHGVDCNEAADEIECLTAEASELRQAVGLTTTFAPHAEMDEDHPLEMMRAVAEHVHRMTAVLDAAREVSRTYILRNSMGFEAWLKAQEWLSAAIRAYDEGRNG